MNTQSSPKPFGRILSFVVLVGLVFSTQGSFRVAAAPADYPYAAQDQSSPSGSGPQVIQGVGPDLSQPLRSMAPAASQAPTSGGELNRHNSMQRPNARNGLTGVAPGPSAAQSPLNGILMPPPDANFEGVANSDNTVTIAPPDTEGDIGYDPATGKRYYMQWVNLSFEIWDVTVASAPVSLYGPVAGNTLWSGFGGWCQATNDGDPIVLYDHLANRWLASQFAWNPGTFQDFHQCVAVSTTADPTGSWYRYDFPISTSLMNDYPKLAVWPDGYYMSVNLWNEPADTWHGVGAVVFNRSAMLSGASANAVLFDIGAVNPEYGSMLPSELDGAAPPAGTPNYFSEWDDSAWITGATSDALRVWNFHVDWGTPSNSTFGASPLYAPNQVIPTTDLGPAPDIVQPGTSQILAALSGMLMHRLQFRNFGSYWTLVGTVTASGAFSAYTEYWFEMRRSGGGWGINQQGIYSPDGNARWMGSIAMDKLGDMALGYSVSGSSTYPSVRYTGRLAGDPLGTLPQGEVTLVAGGGSQTGTYRWGDYSMMGVDPKDDCTFWYTQEYYAATSGWGWKTRIGSFAFPTCLATASWAGSASITSDLSVVAVGRPHVGAEVASYNGFSTGSTSSYLPMLFKNAFGGSYASAFYVQDVDPTNSAHITIDYYDSNGAHTCGPISDMISPLSSHGYWVPSVTCLPSGWVGGAIVTSSDWPIVAVGRPHIGSQVTTYDGFSSGAIDPSSLHSYLPMLFKNMYGNYQSAFYIQNTNPGGSANVTIKFYDTSGNLTCTQYATIPALASVGYWLPSLGCLH